MAEIAGDTSPKTTEGMSLLEICKAKEDAGMSVTKSWMGLWQESLRYFLSDQLRGVHRHKDWEWVIVNYLWPAIQQEIAKLGRNFKFNATPLESSDTEIAEAFQGFLQWQWKHGLHQQGMRVEQLKAILCGKLYGYRVSKVFWEGKVRWESSQRRWLGEVRHRIWHPALFWASDKEYIQDGDCGTVRYLELEYAKSLWPEHKKALEDASVSYPETIRDIGDETIRGQTSSSGTYPSAGTGGIDRGTAQSLRNTLLDLCITSGRTYGPASTPDDKRRYCRISEQYLKDYTEKKRVEVNPISPDVLLNSGEVVQQNNLFYNRVGEEINDSNWPTETVEWDEPLYPNGRYIIRNEDTILNPDKKTQVYPHSVWPFIVTPHYLLPFMWQGSDAISLYRDTQDKINITISHLVNNTKELGDPRYKVEDGALADVPGPTKRKYSVLKGAGAIIKLARGGMKKMEIVPPMPPSQAHILLYQMFTQEFKNIQGLHDIAYGKKTGSKTTATEAQYLAITSNDRIKLQNVFEEEWARQIISLVAEMDQHYYDVGRIVRIVGEDNLIGAAEITQRSKEAKFDIDIEPTEGLPFDEEKRILRYDKAYQILDRPIPNVLLPEYLRVLQISGYQKLLKRHAVWMEFVQFETLLNRVEKGEIAPEEATQVLAQRAMQRMAQMQLPQQKENSNGTIRNSGS